MENLPVTKVFAATTCDCCCRMGIPTKLMGILWRENVNSQYTYLRIYLCDECTKHKHIPLVGFDTLRRCPITQQETSKEKMVIEPELPPDDILKYSDSESPDDILQYSDPELPDDILQYSDSPDDILQYSDSPDDILKYSF